VNRQALQYIRQVGGIEIYGMDGIFHGVKIDIRC